MLGGHLITVLSGITVLRLVTVAAREATEAPKMPSNWFVWLLTAVLIATLFLNICVAGQAEAGEAPNHHLYKVIDIGTLGSSAIMALSTALVFDY